MKIAITSDLHIGSEYYETPLSSLEDIFKDVPKDIEGILIAGDITTGGNVNIIRSVIDWLEENYTCPVLFVPGNHDYYGTEDIHEKEDILKKMFPKNVVLPDFPQELSEDVGVVGGFGAYDVTKDIAPAWALFPDSKYIRRNNPISWNDWHINHLDEFFQIAADVHEAYEKYQQVVLMTHVPPVAKINPTGFDHFFQNAAIGKELPHLGVSTIISGHTHQIICDERQRHYNCPWGYANEKNNYPAIIEIITEVEKEE